MIRRKLTRIEVSLDDTKELDELFSKPLVVPAPPEITTTSTTAPSVPLNNINTSSKFTVNRPDLAASASTVQTPAAPSQPSTVTNTCTVLLTPTPAATTSATSTTTGTSTTAIATTASSTSSEDLAYNPNPYNPSSRFQLN